ncbi:hypothetical protein BBK36DRAFT_1795 [Trichoderma citrinoviride]|uniref:Uncharacterized protein n=1 Tax=Trichoderma citrinoviride TaxID=58853 RepID=A0A2T4BGH2_9HYPO|nr:hypothetical protein BBK36DRAFT_1795 [Trichoderma citrinoviride]PTB68423.1 hypothetical protein BBK36DRAFT_1795 [Trichoderma citrinoviride]
MRHSAQKRRLRLRPWSCAIIIFCGLSLLACALPTTSVSASSRLLSSASAASTLAFAASTASAAPPISISANSRRPSPAPAPAPAPAPSPGHGSESETPQATETSTEGAASATRAAQQQQQQQHHPLPLELQHLAVEGQASPASEPLSIPPYKPIVTPPPDQDAQLAEMGYSMTTFYTCDTVGGQEHCGWHVPVLKADAPTRRTDVRVVLAVVSCLAGILAWGLV